MRGGRTRSRSLPCDVKRGSGFDPRSTRPLTTARDMPRGFAYARTRSKSWTDCRTVARRTSTSFGGDGRSQNGPSAASA